MVPAAKRLALPLAVLLLLAVVTASAPAAKPSPQGNKRLGPSAGAGSFLGYPAPTASWHGCRLKDTQFWPVSLVSGEPTTTVSTSRYVRFRVSPTIDQRFSWKVRPGYKICGAQAAVQLTSAAVRDSDLLAEASYRSGPTSGATAVDGREQIKVQIRPKAIGQAGFEEFEGKTFSIFAFQSVTVFVRKG